MKKLPPVVAGVDGNSLQFKEIEDVDFEFLGFLLSCHLVIEHYLDEFILTLSDKLNWDKARLTFSQKIGLFPAEIFPNGSELVVALKHLNSLRNKFAHNIKTKPSDVRLQPLIDFLNLGARTEVGLDAKPDEILEKFTNLACHSFMGWVACYAHYGNGRAKRPVSVPE